MHTMYEHRRLLHIPTFSSHRFPNSGPALDSRLIVADVVCSRQVVTEQMYRGQRLCHHP